MIKVKTLEKRKILDMSRELELLRSVVIGWVGRDPEGRYNPKFVQEVLENAEDKPVYSFQNKETFLESLGNKR